MVTQSDIDKLTWYHDYDFPNGLKARRAKRPLKDIWSLISRNAAKLDFSGKTVLDIGCWDGYFSFMAEEMGAKRVLAVDDFSQNCGNMDCFKIAAELKNSKVEMRPDVSVYDLNAKINEKFDIILFVGVYYHLHSPYTALAQIRSLCHENTIVLIEGACLIDDRQSYARINLDNPTVSKFVPTTMALEEMCQSCYFSVCDMERLTEEPNIETRAIIIARPFTGHNGYHHYKPNFGLDLFDARFNPDISVSSLSDSSNLPCPDTLRESGKALKNNGLWQEATFAFLKMLRRAVCLNANDHQRSALFHLGECAYNLRRFELARRYLEECITICPDHQAAKSLLEKVSQESKASA